jgi:hypothetical protein
VSGQVTFADKVERQQIFRRVGEKFEISRLTSVHARKLWVNTILASPREADYSVGRYFGSNQAAEKDVVVMDALITPSTDECLLAPQRTIGGKAAGFAFLVGFALGPFTLPPLGAPLREP